jgi:hypothetical protein
MLWRGVAGLGGAWRGSAGQGKGASAHGGVRESSRLGLAGQGWVRQGMARQGKGFYFQTLTGGLNYDFSGRHDKAKAG